MAPHTLRWLAAILLALSTATVQAQSDDPFLSTLTHDGALDRRELAAFMGRVSASLEKGRDGVGVLGVAVEAVAPGKPYIAKALKELQERFEGYGQALDRFSAAAAGLKKEPMSELRLFRVLASGNRVCWLLESQINLAESYGANPGRLPEILTSGSACATLQHVTARADLAEIVESALADRRDDSEYMRENRELKEELRALEHLLDDLLAIDSD